MSNQGNRGYSDNQKNVIQGQRPDIENRHTQQMMNYEFGVVEIKCLSLVAKPSEWLLGLHRRSKNQKLCP